MEGSHIDSDKALKQLGLSGPFRMTPTEACWYMGVPNRAMVVYDNGPEPRSTS